MKTIFADGAVDQFIERVQKIEANLPAQWGKMNAIQMLEHCILAEEMYQKVTPYKRVFIGRILGRIGLRFMTSNDKPIKKNQPTHKNLKLKPVDDKKIEPLKEKWISLLRQYPVLAEKENVELIHPFFGKMTKKQVGIAAYKHADHHLSQFGL